MASTVILIPAYEPGDALVELVQSFVDGGWTQPIVVVDDGSGSSYSDVFATCAAAGCDVIGHPSNRGKGFALKQGFRHIIDRYPGHAVVCADCDGQHRLDDILRVADAVHDDGGVVLGSRRFAGKVPLRSRFGNGLTRYVFFAATRARLNDTQTGLRGYPAALLPWLLAVDGERFEYELDVLLSAKSTGVPVREIPIETIYLEGNASSHFDPIKDSARIYRRLLHFMASSMVSFAIDAIVLFTMMALTDRLLLSVVTARLVSGTCNFLLNRRVVFDSTRDRASSARRYALLAVAVLAANYLLLRALTGVGVGLVAAKLVTEFTLFIISYAVQKRLVFAAGH